MDQKFSTFPSESIFKMAEKLGMAFSGGKPNELTSILFAKIKTHLNGGKKRGVCVPICHNVLNRNIHLYIRLFFLFKSSFNRLFFR